jgi:hypothetical protein
LVLTDSEVSRFIIAAEVEAFFYPAGLFDLSCLHESGAAGRGRGNREQHHGGGTAVEGPTKQEVNNNSDNNNSLPPQQAGDRFL